MKSILYIIALLLVCLASGCSSARLALNEQDWGNQPGNVVHGRMGLTINQSLRFAEFKTDKVKRSWTRTGTSSRYLDFTNITEDFIAKHQAFSFNLTDSAGRALNVACATNVRQRDMTWQKTTSRGRASSQIQSSSSLGNNLHLIITNPDDEEDMPWQLTLNNNSHLANERNAGTLYQSEQDYYYFVPITHMQSANGKHTVRTLDVSGYEIFNQNHVPVAAVSLLNKGVVYLKTQAPAERLLLAAVCSALLLQSDLES